MSRFFSTVSVILVVAASFALAVPVADQVDEVASSLPAARDDGSADLKPPPPPPESDSQHSASSPSVSAEAPPYDPNIYTGLLPSGIPGYPDPYPAGYPQPYPGYRPQPGYPSSYVVQTGYEGYLLPSAPQVHSVQAVPAVTVSPIADPLSFLQGIIPAPMLTWIVRSMAVIMGTITMVIMGGAMTTALCSLTPICSISFKSLKFLNWNETARNVGLIVGTEITPERVRRAADFVHTAIRKYSELQKAFA